MSMYATPDKYALERMRLYALLQRKERDRKFKFAAARRALAIANRLKNTKKHSSQKQYHQSRIMRAINKLRAAV